MIAIRIGCKPEINTHAPGDLFDLSEPLPAELGSHLAMTIQDPLAKYRA